MGQEKLASEIFDRVVQVYDRFLNLATLNRINSWQNELVKNIPKLEIAVDVGTGTGEIVKKVRKNFKNTKIIGLDISFNMLKTAKEKIKDKKTVFIQSSAYSMPFKDKSVDGILLSLVFRHLEDKKAVDEFSRVLKDSGIIGILDITKPPKFIFNCIFFLANVLFRPIGQKIFSKDEYDYFMDSLKNSKTVEELEKFLETYSYKKLYLKKRLFGIIVVAVFQKVK
ncbi:class I SAM-dependent methyltransferase [Persephonella sp.]